MFKVQYFRNYPTWIQFVIFGGIVLALTSFAMAMLIALLPRFTGLSIADISQFDANSPQNIIVAATWLQFFLHAFTFMVPALLFAYFTHPKPFKYLGLVKPGKTSQILLVIVMAIAAIPVFIAIQSVFEQMHFLGATGAKMQKDLDAKEAALMNVKTLPGLVLVFVTMAILPALGEEMLFRGILMRLIKNWKFRRVPLAAQALGVPYTRSNTKITTSIIITSLMFMLMHFNVYGAFSIFLAGALLGFIYYITGSLWCSIAFHLVTNGLQVILSYAATDNTGLKKMVDNNTLPIPVIIISAIVFAASLYLLIKNKTPLADMWPDDFEGEAVFENQS